MPKIEEESEDTPMELFDSGPGKAPKRLPEGDEYKVDVIPGVPNIHCARCGIPPTLDPSLPTGYFTNDYGEQIVMQFDNVTGICRVWMGDCGWDNEMRVEWMNGKSLIRYLTEKEGGKPQEKSEYDERIIEAYNKVYGKLSDEECDRVMRSACVIRKEEVRGVIDFYEPLFDAWRNNEERRQRIFAREERARERESREQLRTELREECKKWQEAKPPKEVWPQLQKTLRAIMGALRKSPNAANDAVLRSLREDLTRLSTSHSTAPES